MKSIDMLETFYRNLIAGEVEGIRAMFPLVPALNTPFRRAVDGDSALIQYVREEGAWLRSMAAEPTVIGGIESPGRVVLELELTIVVREKTTDLPVVLVGQTAPGGFGQIRVYHSMWPIAQEHRERAPIVWPAGALVEPPVICAYFDALSSGDKAAIMATLTDDAYVREPSGSLYRHMGRAALDDFYSAVFAQPGGVPLIHATASHVERQFAVEYICHRWGNATFPPVAGCAVYDLTSDGSLIQAIRIYDDVAPPRG